jgi:phage gpG-like protein
MAFRLAITTTGQHELVRALEDWTAAVADQNTALTQMTLEVIGPILAKRFSRSGPDWAPLSPAYQDWKAIRYGNQPILVASGRMRRAFLSPALAARGGRNTIVLTPQDVPYWRYHQTGTTRRHARPIIQFTGDDTAGTRRMPARPIIQFTGDDTARMGAYLVKSLVGRARTFGLRVSE